MSDHVFIIRRLVEVARGHRLTWRCSACEHTGDITTVTRESALELFGLLQSKHREAREVAR